MRAAKGLASDDLDVRNGINATATKSLPVERTGRAASPWLIGAKRTLSSFLLFAFYSLSVPVYLLFFTSCPISVEVVLTP
jgi:hypothetical protein